MSQRDSLPDLGGSVLPAWYSARYDEDGETIWLPAIKRTWTLPDWREVSQEVSRGEARAAAASEWGEPFTYTRVRKVWMRSGAGEDPEVGWCEDMAWECPKDAEGAMPYWRVDYAPPKRCSRCQRIEGQCTCVATNATSDENRASKEDA